jgi:membrane fusion protein (multidrug efflux system)
MRVFPLPRGVAGGLALAAALSLALIPMGGCASDGQAAAAGDDAAAGARGDGSLDADKKKKEEAVPVEVTALERGRIEEVLRFSANLEAERHVQVYSQAARLVRELLVEEGDRVRKGQVLLRLQDEEQRNNLAKVESQHDRARQEHERLQRLFAENLISEQKFNDTAYELEQLAIALVDAQRELGYTQVQAPIGGIVTSRLIRPGDQVTVGQHLFDLVDFNSIVARVYVPEKNLTRMRTGQQARVTAQALDGRVYTGTIDRIAPVVDPKTGTIKVTVAVGGQAGLLPGLYVDVALVTSIHDDAVLVPKRALVYDQERVFVYRLGDARRVERILVTPVLSDRDFIEPEGLLQAGDQVVVAGQAGLKAGSLVRLPGGDPEREEPAAGEQPASVARTKGA